MMHSYDRIAMSILRFVSGDSEHICRLCFATTEKDEVSVEDCVRVRKSYYDETLTYVTMFRDLGVSIFTLNRYKKNQVLSKFSIKKSVALQVSIDPLLPQVLCKSCATNTINCYLFQKLVVFSNDSWHEVLDQLNNSLTCSDVIGNNAQSIYLMINKSDNLILTSRKRFASKSKKMVLLKIKEIMKSRQKYEKVKDSAIDSICEECGERFSSSLLLIRHMKLHTKFKYPCSKCPKVFSTQIQLEEHAERIHYPKKIQCTKCTKLFSTERMLKVHDSAYHIPAICKQCYIQYPSKKALRAHMDKHKLNRCLRCNKHFLNKHTYKFHLNICGNGKEKQPSFFCDICNKGYVRKNGLRTHLKTDHGFGKVLTCNWCNKKFDAVSRLKNHIVKHTRERNFSCEQCGGKFVTHAALIYHIRLHTGERPFPCDICDESFLSASRRMEHKRRKHIGPTEECPVCHVKFITGHQLRKHVQRHFNPHSKLYVADVGQQYSIPAN